MDDGRGDGSQSRLSQTRGRDARRCVVAGTDEGAEGWGAGEHVAGGRWRYISLAGCSQRLIILEKLDVQEVTGNSPYQRLEMIQLSGATFVFMLALALLRRGRVVVHTQRERRDRLYRCMYCE